jgi:hypothetical protein
MPVSPVIANTMEVRLLWSMSGQGAINVLHGLKVGAVTNSQTLANTLGTAIKAAFTSNLGSHCPAGAGIIRVGTRDLSTANQPEFLDTNALVSGTAVTDALPTSVAVCVTLRTALSGKSFRGRVYLGGFSEADNDPSGIGTQTLATACTSFMTAVSAAMTASSLTLAVSSRPAEAYTITKFTTHNDGTTSTRTIGRGAARSGQSNAVTSLAVRNLQWESQRRRTNGRGAPASLFNAASEVTLGH